MNFTTEFTDNVLYVILDGRTIIAQPFKPTSSGEQVDWASEQEALAWWETQQSQYITGSTNISEQPI